MIIKILVVLVAILSVAMTIAMFSKDKYTLKRVITIHKPKQEVFEYIRLLKNQNAYSKWLQMDKNTKIAYKGAADGQAGSILAFDSENPKAGKGEWETVSLVNNERVNFELRFIAPFEFTANGHMVVNEVATDKTQLTWVYNSGMKWPANFMLLFMDMDKIIGTDLEESMNNIKRNLELGTAN